MILELKDVSLDYEGKRTGKLRALESISFSLAQGEGISIVGPSGCGKSSLLSLISGIRPATSGRILHKGEVVTGPSRQRVLIFQNHALYPWKTAQENVEFVLRARAFRGSLATEALRYLALVGLEKFAGSYPKELSGGMQQRVGIARALAADPEILLLDEPFASLDALTRGRVLEEFTEIVRSLKKAFVLVSHNVEEAIYLGTRVILMSGRPGRVLENVEVPLSKPGTISELRLDSAFRELEARIHDRLRSEVVL